MVCLFHGDYGPPDPAFAVSAANGHGWSVARPAVSLAGERYRAAHETGITIKLVQTIHWATWS
jgi:hypothetical protein